MGQTGRTQVKNALGRLYLLGPLVLLDENGTHCTPTGKKCQALLALLALSPRGVRTRAWIRDKLWSTSTEERSSSSLRQTVFEIKKALGHFADTFLLVERNSIQLRLDRIWIDVRVATDNPGKFDLQDAINMENELLEGLDVRDEEFEDWLLMERRLWEEKSESLLAKPAITSPQNVVAQPENSTVFKKRVSIAMLPTIRHGCTEQSAVIADQLIDAITHNIVEFYPNDILDFRTTDQNTDGKLDMLAADYFIRARILDVMDNLTVTLFLYRSNTTELIWSQSIQTTASELMEDRADLLNRFVAQNVDRLARTIFRETKLVANTDDDQGGSGYGALLQMFELDESALTTSRNTLEILNSNSPHPLFESLLAYSDTFRIGENVGTMNDSTGEKNWSRVQNLLQQNSFNSVALASLGHVLGYMYSKHEIAADLLKKAVQLNPSQAFVWDHLALHCLYTGKLEEAEYASRRATNLGIYSPLSYSYETTSCMIASLRGQHERAVRLGESVLSKKPRFTAAMRYTLSSYGHLGCSKEADTIVIRLKKADPDFFHKETQKERFRLPIADAQKQVMAGIKRAGY